MTTNRGTEIDDAIVSRLTARVTYTLPNEEERAKIWKMLAFENGLTLSENLVSQLCDKFPDTSGRDIKNILKLAKLVSAKDGYKMTFDLIKRLMKFKQ